MLYLLLNTCGAESVVALGDEERVLAEETLPGRSAGEALLPAMRRLFTAVGSKPAELNGVVVVDGPGSFTGVRVGLSSAKGLAEAAACSFLAISRLKLLAAGRPGALALLDAGRGELFCGCHDADGRWREQLLTAEAVRALLADRGGVCCEAQVQAVAGVQVEVIAEPGAELMRREALRLIAVGQWSDPVTADANYLRRTDAEMLEERR